MALERKLSVLRKKFRSAAVCRKRISLGSNVVFPGYPFPEDPLAEPQDPDSVPAKTDGPPFDEVAFDKQSDGVDLAVGV